MGDNNDLAARMGEAGYGPDDWKVKGNDVLVYGYAWVGTVEEVPNMSPADIKAAVEAFLAAEQSRREAEEEAPYEQQ